MSQVVRGKVERRLGLHTVGGSPTLSQVLEPMVGKEVVVTVETTLHCFKCGDPIPTSTRRKNAERVRCDKDDCRKEAARLRVAKYRATRAAESMNRPILESDE